MEVGWFTPVWPWRLVTFNILGVEGGWCRCRGGWWSAPFFKTSGVCRRVGKVCINHSASLVRNFKIFPGENLIPLEVTEIVRPKCAKNNFPFLKTTFSILVPTTNILHAFYKF